MRAKQIYTADKEIHFQVDFVLLYSAPIEAK